MLLHYIDNEVPAFGEWDQHQTSGAGVLAQTAAASFPDRGAAGLEIITSSASDLAWCGISPADPTLGDVYVGMWFNVQAVSGGQLPLACVANDAGSSAYAWMALVTFSDQMYLRMSVAVSGTTRATANIAISPGRWHYLVVRYNHSASPANCHVWLDGMPAAQFSNIQAGTWRTGHLRVGNDGVYTGHGHVFIDEIKLSTVYPEPFSPSPAVETLCPRRTVVLYQAASPTSRQWADNYAAAANIPIANLVPLDCPTDETLESYDDYYGAIASPLADYLSRNTQVAANCMCFLLGPELPGYYINDGCAYSVTAQLTTFGQEFQPGGRANPLFNPAIAGRLTVGQLRAAGVYLASRIDGPTPEDAAAIVARAATVIAGATLANSQRLLCDDSAFVQSVGCQRLRLSAGELDGESPITDDAFVFGNATGMTFAAGAARAAIVHTAAGSAGTLRDTSECLSALSAGYAAAVGFADADEVFSPPAFFEMLRIGGTVAEAAMAASARLGGTMVLAGDPLMTVPLPKAGYNVYLGHGDIAEVDWANPVACTTQAGGVVDVNITAEPGQFYTLAARAVSTAGIEERNTHVMAVLEASPSGELVQRLDVPTNVEACVVGGLLRMDFDLIASPGFAAPETFDIFTDNGTGTLDMSSAVASMKVNDESPESFSITFTPPTLPAGFAVAARRGSTRGPLSELVQVTVNNPITPMVF